MNPLIVLLAFIMLALSALVIVLISGKFEQQLKEFNKTGISGVHKADIGRMSIAAAAFSLGISNMRRRKARTVLTCITLVLLTFIVLSFTSVVSGMRFNIVAVAGHAALRRDHAADGDVGAAGRVRATACSTTSSASRGRWRRAPGSSARRWGSRRS